MTDRKPLEPKSDNASLNSEIAAATEIQSEVTPEDYPLDQRARIDPKEAAARGGKSRHKP
jgi:hypothetical protein